MCIVNVTSASDGTRMPWILLKLASDGVLRAAVLVPGAQAWDVTDDSDLLYVLHVHWSSRRQAFYFYGEKWSTNDSGARSSLFKGQIQSFCVLCTQFRKEQANSPVKTLHELGVSGETC